MRDRWPELCARLRAPLAADPWFDILEALHAWPPRTYHNLEHVSYCLMQMDRVRGMAQDPEQIEFALWFHDCIYVPGRKDNEERSAAIAQQAAASIGRNPQWIRQVQQLVLATKHIAPPATADAALLMDIDMSILASAPDKYRRYAGNIRAEFAFATDDQFRAGRSAFLRGLLASKAIFHSQAFAELEPIARENMARELETLATINAGGISL